MQTKVTTMKCHFIFHGGRFKIQVSKELPELFVSTFSDAELLIPINALKFNFKNYLFQKWGAWVGVRVTELDRHKWCHSKKGLHD